MKRVGNRLLRRILFHDNPSVQFTSTKGNIQSYLFFIFPCTLAHFSQSNVVSVSLFLCAKGSSMQSPESWENAADRWHFIYVYLCTHGIRHSVFVLYQIIYRSNVPLSDLYNNTLPCYSFTRTYAFVKTFNQLRNNFVWSSSKLSP